MTETKPIEPLSERVRKRLLKHMTGAKPCPTCGHVRRGAGVANEQLGKAIGITAWALQSFAKTGKTTLETLNRISAWFDGQVEKEAKK